MKIALLLTSLLAGAGVAALAAPDQTTNVATFISGSATAHNFNGTILVQRNGETIYFKSFGKANLQHNVPNRNDTKYKIASITKLFTSVLVMQLQEEGKLELDKSIKTYLPGYTGEGAHKVTLHHLLTATSGLESSEKHGDSIYEERHTTDEILQKYCSGKLENEPGKMWNYNNADFIILGKVIEAVCHAPFEQVLREKILQPLSMNSSGLCSSAAVVEGLASTYGVNERTRLVENDPLYYIENYYAAGAMYSTAGDLLKFAEALYGYRLLKENSVQIILKPNLRNYGYGLWIFEKDINHHKIRIAERQGSIEGTNTRFLRLLDNKVTIILLSNLWSPALNMDELQDEIMKAVLSK